MDNLSIKILGLWTTQDNSMLHHISKIRGQVYKSLSTLKPYLKYMNLEQRKLMVYSKVLGKASYGVGLYIGQTKSIKDKITAISMRAN